MSLPTNEVELIRMPGGINAESILAALRGSGIPARSHGEAVGPIYGLTLDGLGEVSIFVPAEYLEQARAILEAGDMGELEVENDDSIDANEPGGE
jgi:hypothetical protein